MGVGDEQYGVMVESAVRMSPHSDPVSPLAKPSSESTPCKS